MTKVSGAAVQGPRRWFWATLACVFVGVSASAVLYADHHAVVPMFCSAVEGCATARRSAWAAPLGVPLPAIGLLGLLATGVSALAPGRGARRLHAGLAVTAGLVGLWLLGVQVVWLRAICVYCALIDGSSIVLGLLAALRMRKGWDSPWGAGGPPAKIVAGVFAVLALAAIGPLGSRWWLVRRALDERHLVDASGVLAEEALRTPPHVVTIVDFVDVECPFCRRTHHALMIALRGREDLVRVVRKHVPLRIHPHAEGAAKAVVCAEPMGKADALLEALITAPPSELGPEGIDERARAVGIDPAVLERCSQSSFASARIERDRETFYEVGARGLPTLWIDGVLFEGEQSESSLALAVTAAISRRNPR